MRQGQQNRRGRGRGRKIQNPLARNFESNGPDVKIRGTAAHIAEKYAALARDAAASGDNVTAENYLQHAEHYNRIIMTAQGQLGSGGPQVGDGANGAGTGRQPRGFGAEEGPMPADIYGSGEDMDDAGEGSGSEDAPLTAADDGTRRGGERGKRQRANGSGDEAEDDGQAAGEDTDSAIA